ncbi:MAG: hypothetical protein P4L35_18770 [Ignavibacteriaceae bacterium]|nr:hypothetical protein [Ignavibacteriaceae bacterium]
MNDEHKYLNINIINSKQENNFYQNNPTIKFSDSFSQAILDDCKQYAMAINRFDTNCGLLLPIWSPTIQINQSDPNLCCQNITMSVNIGGTIYTQTTNMVYESENATASPSSTLLLYDNSHYYYVYSMSHIVYLFNNMVQSCFNAIQTQVGDGFIFPCACPFLAYDSSSGLFSMYFDQSGEPFNVFFDNNLYNMFSSFYFRNTNQLVIDNNNGLNSVTIGDKTFTKVTQDFISTALFSPVHSLVFTTSKIPIAPEITTNPLQFYDQN